jgi:hypothetical protein
MNGVVIHHHHREKKDFFIQRAFGWVSKVIAFSM